MKKIFLAIIVLFSLTSCFSSSTTDTSSLSDFTGSWFTIKTPKTWTLLDQNNASLPKPKDSSIVLAISSPDVKYWFANNMLILKTKLAKNTSSKTYSDLNNLGSSRDYKNYLKLDKKDITFSDEDISTLYIFQAKYNESTPNLKFMQTAHICPDMQAYFITIALNIDVKDTSKYEEMLKTFTCN